MFASFVHQRTPAIEIASVALGRARFSRKWHLSDLYDTGLAALHGHSMSAMAQS